MRLNLGAIPYAAWAPACLVLARSGSLFAASPLWGSSVLPISVRALLGILISFATLTAGVKVSLPPEALFPIALLTEVAVGLVIGYLSTLVFSLFRTAGGALDAELGFTVAQVFNPMTTSGEETLLANWLDLLGTLIFLFLGGTELLLLAAVQSFKVIPMNVTVLVVGPQAPDALVRAFIGSFLLAVEVAAPIVLSLLLIDLLGAALGRLLPQLNILTFNIPVKMWLGFGMVAIFLPALADAGRLAMGLLGQSVTEILGGL